MRESFRRLVDQVPEEVREWGLVGAAVAAVVWGVERMGRVIAAREKRLDDLNDVIHFAREQLVEVERTVADAMRTTAEDIRRAAVANDPELAALIPHWGTLADHHQLADELPTPQESEAL
jgi:hypothetical protein